MKVQIYAGVLSVIWLLAVLRACEEANNRHSSDLNSNAAWTIMIGGVLLPLVGRVWGWW
jgi:hypothetical protein